jgi:DNA replication and repair protein RecF
MHLKKLSVVNFKNFHEANLEFSPKFNCFSGNNGAGKTNLLDAIYYLSFCKSFSNPIDSQNIYFEKDFFLVQGHYQVNGREDEIYCGLKRQQRKVFKRNKKEYERLSDHIGTYPLVMISPNDTQLILGGSDDRRKFLDGVVSQYNHEYLHHLLQYNKALQQRNALLKIFAEKRRFDAASLEIWDEQLVINGSMIFDERQRFFEAFMPVFREYYQKLSGGNEMVDIQYQSSLYDSDFREQLLEAREKDRIAQYTTMGIHKDDLTFLIHDVPVKKFGSQGQQKSFIIALKLAQFAFTKKIKGFNPILLFDDIFDKLDSLRVKELMHMVSEENFGQVFVTDTHAGRLEELLENIHVPGRIFAIEQGTVSGSKSFNDPTPKSAEE